MGFSLNIVPKLNNFKAKLGFFSSTAFCAISVKETPFSYSSFNFIYLHNEFKSYSLHCSTY